MFVRMVSLLFHIRLYAKILGISVFTVLFHLTDSALWIFSFPLFLKVSGRRIYPHLFGHEPAAPRRLSSFTVICYTHTHTHTQNHNLFHEILLLPELNLVTTTH